MLRMSWICAIELAEGCDEAPVGHKARRRVEEPSVMVLRPSDGRIEVVNGGFEPDLQLGCLRFAEVD